MQSATIFFILVGLLVIFQETEGAAAVKRLVGGNTATTHNGVLKPNELPQTVPVNCRFTGRLVFLHGCEDEDGVKFDKCGAFRGRSLLSSSKEAFRQYMQENLEEVVWCTEFIL